MKKPIIGRIILLGVGALLLFIGRGCYQYWSRGGPWLAVSYVSDRPDLTYGCDDRNCAAWAQDHAADFLTLAQVRDLHIAIMQTVLAPSPDTIVIKCSFSSQDLKNFLRGKKRLSTTVQAVVKEFAGRGFSIREFPFNRLSWWPPKPSLSSSLAIYEGRSMKGGHHYIFVDSKAKVVFVLAPAGRGR